MKNIKNTNRKNVKWMAAAVLTASLLGVQIMPAVAADKSAAISTNMIMPENITIEYPVSLSEISLPESEYGKLSWADDTLVPSRRSEAFEVIFRPSESVSLSQVEGWDGESEKITGYVTIVVSSMDSEEWEPDYEPEYDLDSDYDSEYSEDEEWSQETEEGSTEAEVDCGEQDSAQLPGEDINQEDKSEESAEGGEASAEEKEDSLSEDKEQETDKEQGSDKEQETDKEQGSDKEQETDKEQGSDKEQETDKEQGSDKEQETDKEQGSDKEQETDKEQGSDKEQESDKEQNSEEPDSKEDAGEEKEPDVNEGSEEDIAKDDQEEDPDNIFDNADTEVKDDRPATAEDDLTEEEMLQRAQENHSCDGISVSGIHLPWYVQFRATNGESYEFSNESQANIFRSYEFELWDLKNDTEYEIPDGEYISVTIPVREGYEYTIEHLLDNGAVETIIPSVDGSTLIFSTHSFSPFGIAGSKPLVGGDISDGVYVTPTPTTPPSKTPTKAPSGGQNSNNNNGSTGNNNTNNDNTNNSNTNSSTGNSAGSNNIGSKGPDKDHPGYGTKAPTQAAKDNGSSDNSGLGNNAGEKTEQNAGQSSGDTSSARAVKTGDDTQILPFVALVAAAVLIIGIVIFLKRKKK